ncbi:uncharacterized protein LOC131289621 [Anopheles ziemanni]|uniref:uncharacterized protein LOC131261255 n=1 Tax=Anopheles coustani TaxID=139045 RepID=UPI00265ABC74|nr:uncharacterized protein LOC131261255 [Anopheles coustani]XP_058174898.1 uncharacterized protein LOC131289621 [Anopheles ziemanni]
MVKEMPSSTVSSRDEECLRKSLMEVVKSDSSSICRLCLSKEQKLTRVFEDESGIDDALLKKIFDCTSVKVKLKNVFPSAICAICDLKLNDFYKFREKCIENNTILHNLLGETDLSSEVQDPGTTSEPAKDGEYMQQDEEKEHEQQAATSTTSITESQQNEATVAIALNQLSELGIRTMLDMAAAEKDDGLDVGGGSNVVSSSWGATVQAAAQAESVSTAHSTNRKRTCVLSEMEMDSAAGAGLRREGKYECKECRRTFRNAYTLRRHNNLHTRTNLFPCEYCGKKFNDRSNWKIHQRSHTGDNLYTCLVCLKTFISPSTLKYHLRSHRRLESFDCRVCHESFGSYDLLEEHARNLHQQQGYMGMEDYAADGDQLIDAARFVKIELEDGELPSPAMAADISTTSQSKRMANHSIGDDDDDLDEDMQLPDEGMLLREANGKDHPQRQQEHQELVGSSLGQGCPVSHAQVAQLVEQRRQQLLEQVLQEQAKNMGILMTTGNEMSTIKQEVPADRSGGGDVQVKEEPQDDSFEMDPSELLQQAMEEADVGDQEKEHSSSSSSSPSTVIMFRCDYCMKIFRYLDELNAHMVLHNGINGAAGNSALVLGSLDPSGASTAVAHLPLTDQMRTNEHDAAQLQALMLKQFAASRSRPIGSDEGSFAGAVSQQYSAPGQQLQVVYRRVGDGVPSGITERRRNAFEPDPEEIVNVPPPEHPCSKCSKMFRTEELRRVHEATHANDELVNKVRSCRFCNKVFKCELNLLAHLRKHHSHHSMPGESDGGTGGADSSGSGNEESCSSISNAIQQQRQLDQSTSNEGAAAELHGDGGGAISDGEAGSGSTGGKSLVSRRCEICAISFTDGALLEKHVLSHFERNEAVAFVPSTDRPFKCTECHKRFKRKDYLLIHIRTHTGERRYKCDLCSSAFVHPSNLITHRKLHSNERPHKCNLCSATFKLFAGLKIHRRRCEQKLPRLTSGSSDQEDHCFRWGK